VTAREHRKSRDATSLLQRDLLRSVTASAVEQLTRILVVLAGLVAASGGCSRRYTDGDVWGDPKAPSRGTGASLDARPDAPSAPAPDAPSPVVNPVGPDAGAPPTANPDTAPVTAGPMRPGSAACQKCEDRICSHHELGDLVSQCYVEPDPANPRKIGRGPRPDLLFTEACRRVVECVLSSRCFAPTNHRDPEASRCYCGDVDGTECLFEPGGPCKEQIQHATGSDDHATVLTKLQDPIFGASANGTPVPNAAGVAMRLVNCNSLFCSPPCFGYNACAAQSSFHPVGNPLCDTDICRNDGDCMPLSECIASTECLEPPAPDGGSSSGAAATDGGSAPHSPPLTASSQPIVREIDMHEIHAATRPGALTRPRLPMSRR
jgi:hypothetical protein